MKTGALKTYREIIIPPMNNIEIVNVVVDIAFGVTYVANAALPCAMRYFSDRERTRRVMTSDTCHQKRNLKWEITVALSNTVHLFSKTRVTALYPFARKLKSVDPQHAPLLLRTSSHQRGVEHLNRYGRPVS